MTREEINQLIKSDQWELLVQIGEPAVEPLIDSIRTIEFSSIRFVLAILGDIGDRRAVDTLIHFLNVGNYTIISSAIKSLGKIGDPKAIEPLITVLKNDKKKLRREAAQALGTIGDPKAIESLIRCLTQPDKHLRHEAAVALTCINDPRSSHALFGYILNREPSQVEALGNYIVKLLRLTNLQSWAITKRDNYNWRNKNA